MFSFGLSVPHLCVMRECGEGSSTSLLARAARREIKMLKN